MTLAIPSELKKRMGRHLDVRWSEVARLAFEKKVEELEWADNALRNSRLSEADAEKIGNNIKAEIWKRFSKRFST